MRINIEDQYLSFDGKKYTLDNLHLLKSKIEDNEDASIFDLFEFLVAWFDDSPFVKVYTSGSTGKPKALTVRKDQMVQSARLTCEYLGLKEGDSALLCMNLHYIGAMMMVVRALVAGLNLIVRPASGHPLATLDETIRFAAMVPLQVYNALQTSSEREKLEQIEILIIGGGAIDKTLEEEIRTLSGAVYSTYGMTETLSHIALRRLSGESFSEHYYPFSSVELSLSLDQTLVIDAPLICDEVLQTNDIAKIYPDGSFVILGRSDNVINSGGIKVCAEELEMELQAVIPVSFVITSVADVRLGQAIVLLITHTADVATIEKQIQSTLSPYRRPKYVLSIADIPQTENGKIDRQGCSALAQKLVMTKQTHLL